MDRAKLSIAAICILTVVIVAQALWIQRLEKRVLELHIQQSFAGTETARLRGILISTRVLLGLPEEESSPAEEAAALQRFIENGARHGARAR